MQKQPQGFTLVELLIVVAIVGVTAAFGLPALQTLVINSRLSADANNLVAALNLARSRAIATHYRVGVTNKLNTTSTFSGWGKGYQVYIDVDGGTTGNGFTDGDTTLQTYPPISSSFSLTPSSDTLTNIAYKPDGRSSVATSFYLCAPRPKNNADNFKKLGRRVVIAGTGRISTQKVTEPNTDNLLRYNTQCP